MPQCLHRSRDDIQLFTGLFTRRFQGNPVHRADFICWWQIVDHLNTRQRFRQRLAAALAAGMAANADGFTIFRAIYATVHFLIVGRFRCCLGLKGFGFVKQENLLGGAFLTRWPETLRP